MKKQQAKEKNSRDVNFNRHKIAEALHGKEITIEAKGSGDKIFG